MVPQQLQVNKGKGSKVQSPKWALEEGDERRSMRMDSENHLWECAAVNIIISKPWNLILETVGKYGPNLKGPIAYELSEKYLPIEVAAKKELPVSFLQSCKIHGCISMSDAWIDRKGWSIMNMILNSYSGTMFYDSKNTSKDIHNALFIYNLINNAIEKIGEGSVV